MMSKFGDAFKEARAAGKKEFIFNNKRYHTKTKEEMAAAKKPAAKKPATSTTSRAGQAYQRMAASPGGVPGKAAKPASKMMSDAINARGKPGGNVEAKPKKPVRKYGRNRSTTLINSPKTSPTGPAKRAKRRGR